MDVVLTFAFAVASSLRDQWLQEGMAVEMNVESRWHTVSSTALGNLTLVRDAVGLVGLYYPHHWTRPETATFGPRRDEGFEQAIEQIGAYLAGERPTFDLAMRLLGDEFQRRVWALVRQVPYGDTVTYGDLARRVGGATTAQQVGAAVGLNPLCIIVPCHRVVGAGGKLTGYAGGLTRKRHLLDLEQLGQPQLMLPDTVISRKGRIWSVRSHETGA